MNDRPLESASGISKIILGPPHPVKGGRTHFSSCRCGWPSRSRFAATRAGPVRPEFPSHSPPPLECGYGWSFNDAHASGIAQLAVGVEEAGVERAGPAPPLTTIASVCLPAGSVTSKVSWSGRSCLPVPLPHADAACRRAALRSPRTSRRAASSSRRRPPSLRPRPPPALPLVSGSSSRPGTPTASFSPFTVTSSDERVGHDVADQVAEVLRGHVVAEPLGHQRLLGDAAPGR